MLRRGRFDERSLLSSRRLTVTNGAINVRMVGASD